MRYDVSDKAFDIRTANKIKCKCGHTQLLVGWQNVMFLLFAKTTMLTR